MIRRFFNSARLACGLVFLTLSWLVAVSAAAPDPARLEESAGIVRLSGLFAHKDWNLRRPTPVKIEGTLTWMNEAKTQFVIQDGDVAASFNAGPLPASVNVRDRVLVAATNAWPSTPAVPDFPFKPSGSELLANFDEETKNEMHVLDRLRGYVVAPADGEYTFWISSDDASELWLSPHESPEKARVVAYANDWTEPRDWLRYASQKSDPVQLRAGQRYYIEALHVQNSGPGHLAVAWEGPGMKREIIPTAALRPWATNDEAAKPGPGVLREYWNDASAKHLDLLREHLLQSSLFNLENATVSTIGSGVLPEPININPANVLRRDQEHVWAEIVGVVTFVSRNGNALDLEVSSGDKPVRVHISQWEADDIPRVKNGTVKLHGVVETEFDTAGNRHPSGLLMTRGETIQVVAPVKDWARIESVHISDIETSKYTNAENRLVRVRGFIANRRSGKYILLRDQGYFEAEYSKDGRVWKPYGERVVLPMAESVYIGLVGASHTEESTASATFDHISGLSPNPRNGEIGDSKSPGAVSRDGDAFTVKGSGGDIWEASDQFHFVYQSLEGDGEIVARVSNFHNSSVFAKAGLMVRETLKPDSPFIDVLALGANSVSVQWRGGEFGSRAMSSGDQLIPMPVWLKLRRRHSEVWVATDQPANLPVGSMVEAVGYLDFSNGSRSIRDAFFRAVEITENRLPKPDADRPLLTVRNIIDTEGPLLPDAFRIQGVVTFSGKINGVDYLSVQDDTAGIFVPPADELDRPKFRAGEFVAIETDPWYGREKAFHSNQVIPLGRGSFPQPVFHPTEYLLPRKGEGQWVEIDGVVYSADQNGLALIKNRSGFFFAWVEGMATEDWMRLVDGTVRLRGAVAYPKGGRELVLVPTKAEFEIVEKPPVDVSSLPLRSLNELTTGDDYGKSIHRLRTSGVVTYCSKTFFTFQQGSVGATARVAPSRTLNVGDRVEVVGFLELSGDGAISLVEPVVQKLGQEKLPEPIETSIEKVTTARPLTTLVRLRARVLGTTSGDSGQSLELQAGGRNFRAVIDQRGNALASLPEGSEIEATGVFFGDGDLAGWQNRAESSSGLAPFRLLLRSKNDVDVLSRPSWWRLKRALMVIGGLLVILAVVLTWVTVLRRRVEQRTKELEAATKKLQEEALISATLAERNRLAGEIHDSLEQGFSGLLLQLDAMAKMPGSSSEIREALGVAKNMVSFSRADVHHAVWNLQSPVLEESDLATALTNIARQVSPTSPRIEIKVDGPRQPLPSAIEHHLLRIGQEAMTNAVKHASATAITVELKFRPNEVVLGIRDNGVGFRTDEALGGSKGHFGLRSLRSRAKKINGQLEIRSQPGQGSSVVVTVPLKTSADVTL